MPTRIRGEADPPPKMQANYRPSQLQITIVELGSLG